MFKFDMTTECNYASFHDNETGRIVHVDSFDNVEFNAWITRGDEYLQLGSFKAESNDSLNSTLNKLVNNK
ncbi:hypothetical protein A203_18690 [Chromobacterium violaceum]|uniref:hypothetical protein n=1 Tax=Chromobacterium violaceum TaxID=536 RepID=UPI003CF2D417